MKIEKRKCVKTIKNFFLMIHVCVLDGKRFAFAGTELANSRKDDGEIIFIRRKRDLDLDMIWKIVYS